MNWLNIQENLTTIVGAVTGVDHVTLAPGFVDISRDGGDGRISSPGETHGTASWGSTGEIYSGAKRSHSCPRPR